MKTAIRLLSVLLSALMIILAFASCAESGGGDTTTAAPDQDTGNEPTAEVTTERLDDFGRPWVDDDLPESLDMGGRDFTVHLRGGVEEVEWYAPEENGEMLNDAIFKRNTTVETRYGFKINVIAEGSWKDYDSNAVPKITASIMSGDGTYDLLAGYSKVTSLATSGLLLNLRALDQINFDKPWWSSNFNEELTVNGANYFGVGALSLSMVYSMENIFVNLDILNDSAGAGYNIYDTVKEHKWTFEELEARAKEAWQDRNGNGKVDAQDIIGMGFPDSGNAANGFMYCTGAKFGYHTDEGTLTAEGLDVEKTSDVIDACIELLFKAEGVYPAGSTAVDFADGTSLFYFRWLYWGQTEYAKKMDHYGVIPMPLLNTDQPDYVTPVQGGMHIYCIPIDVKSIEQNAIITEALAAESYRTLLPSYYEIVLKTRYAKDMETSQMIDIIYDSVAFDIAYIYRSNVNYVERISGIITSQRNAFSSNYTAIKKVAENGFQNLTAALTPKN